MVGRGRAVLSKSDAAATLICLCIPVYRCRQSADGLGFDWSCSATVVVRDDMYSRLYVLIIVDMYVDA